MREVDETMTVREIETEIETVVIGGDIPGPAALMYVSPLHESS